MKKRISCSFLWVFASALALSAPGIASNDGASSGESSSTAPQKLPNRLDAKSYLGLNNDVQSYANTYNLKEKKFAKQHFDQYGKTEGRPHLTKEQLAKLPEDFNPELYLKLHPEVRKYAEESGSDPITFAKFHYLNSGEREQRAYKEPVGASDSTRTNEEAPLEGPKESPSGMSSGPHQEGPSTSGAETPPAGQQPSVPSPLPGVDENQATLPGLQSKSSDGSEGALSPQPVPVSPSQPSDPNIGSNPEGEAQDGQANTGAKFLDNKAHMTRPKNTNKRPPTRGVKPSIVTKNPFETAGSADSAGSIQERPSPESSDTTTTTTPGGDSSARENPAPVKAIPPKGMGYGVSLGNLTNRKTESPQDKMAFVKAKMAEFSTLDPKTKREVEGKLITILRDVLKPGDDEYAEFKGYQDQLKGANADKPEVSFGKVILRKVPPEAVKKTDQDGAASSTDGSKIPSSEPTPPAAPGTSAPKGPAPSPVQKLGSLSRQIDDGKASAEFLNKNRSFIERDLAAVKKNNSEDLKVMATVSKIEEALRAVQPKPADEGSVHKSSFSRPLSTEGDLITPVQFSPTTPVMRAPGDADDRSTPTQS